MDEHQKQLNEFLVVTFNEILRYEEAALQRWTDANLSISEIHVIEMVFSAVAQKQNTASQIAKMLHITLGSLTVAVNTLESKGYLQRERSQEDKRVVYILPTSRAEVVNQYHQDFHHEMIVGLLDNMNEQEEKVLAAALSKVRDFFLKKSLSDEEK